MSYKILHVGDEHLADVPPSFRKVSYRSDMMAKEQEIVELAKKLKVDAVVRSGDIFHIKSPSRNSHGMVSELMDIWKQLKDVAPNYLVIGNHDLRNDSMQSLPDQPIRDLISAEVVTLIPEGEEGLLLTPGNRLSVRIAAIYGYGHPDAGNRERYAMKRSSDEEILIKATHTSLFPIGHGFPANVEYTTLDQLTKHGPDIYLAGHIHEHYGVTHLGDTYLSMPGSISRGSLPEVKADRSIIVNLLSIEKRGSYKFEEIPLKSAKSAKDVFTLPLAELQKTQVPLETKDKSIDSYVNFLKESTSENAEWSLKNEILAAANAGADILPKAASEYLLNVCEELSIN